MLNLLIIWVALIHNIFASNSRSIHIYQYDVLRNGKVVGFMHCIKKQSGNTISYSNESKIKINLLVEVNIHNRLESSFVDGRLQSGAIKRIINGKTKTDTKIEWKDAAYQIQDGNKKALHTEKIYATTAGLMFNEPINIERIYSENFKQFVNIKRLSGSRYALKLPDGFDNIYTYEKGICKQVEVKTAMATVFINAREN